MAAALAAAGPAAAADQWSEPAAIGAAGGVPEAAFDGKGNLTVAWQGEDGYSVFASTRPAGGRFSAPKRISGTVRGGIFKLEVNEAGDAVVGITDDDAGVWGTVRPAGGDWRAPQRLSSDAAAFEFEDKPDVAIGAGGTVAVAWPRGQVVTHRVMAAVGNVKTGFGGQEVAYEKTGRMGFTHVSPGVDAAGNVIVGLVDQDCDAQGACHAWLRAVIRPSGGPFGQPVAVTDVAGVDDPPPLSVSAGGQVAMVWTTFTGCEGGHCVSHEFAATGRLPGPPGPPREFLTASTNTPADVGRTHLVPRGDGGHLAWWLPFLDTGFDAMRIGSGGELGAVTTVPGGPPQYLQSAVDGDGDVLFFDTRMNSDLFVQRWTPMEAVGPPLAVAAIPASVAAAVGPGTLAAVVWTDRSTAPERARQLTYRIFGPAEERTSPGATEDVSPPLVAVVTPPRARGSTLRLAATADERCTVAGSGLLRVAGRVFRVLVASRVIRPGVSTQLTVRPHARDRAKVRRVLRGRGRKALTLRLAARDAAGNRRTIVKNLVVRS